MGQLSGFHVEEGGIGVEFHIEGGKEKERGNTSFLSLSDLPFAKITLS